jgi:hypothetical protein
MTSSALPQDRPITRRDLEQKLDQIRTATESGRNAARGAGLAVGIAVVAVLVVGAFLLGSRRGKRRRTLVEVRRV